MLVWTVPSDIYSDKGQALRGRAKAITKSRQSNYLIGRLGLVIDGTGKDVDKIQKQVAALRGLGYDTYMIFVNTVKTLHKNVINKEVELLQEMKLLECGMKFKRTSVHFSLYSVQEILLLLTTIKQTIHI